MSLAGRMPEIDAAIFAAIGEGAVIRGQQVPGIFNERYREIPLPDGSVMGLNRTFDTQVTAAVLALEDQELVTIPGRGNYRFLQRIPERGDESGRVTLVLGSLAT